MDSHQIFDSCDHQSIQDQLHQFLPPLDNQMNSIENVFTKKYDHLSSDPRKESDEIVNTQNTVMPQLTKKLSTPKKKRIRKYVSNNPNNKKGHWTHAQKIKYHWFLQLNAQKFIERERRKVQKTFKSMSVFIQTRQAHQCRSHHQKTQKKLGSFPKILLNLRKHIYGTLEADKVKQNMEKAGYEYSNLIQSDLLQNEQKLYFIYCKPKSEKEVSSEQVNECQYKYGSDSWNNQSSLSSEDKKNSSQNKIFLSDEYDRHFPTDIK